VETKEVVNAMVVINAVYDRRNENSEKRPLFCCEAACCEDGDEFEVEGSSGESNESSADVPVAGPAGAGLGSGAAAEEVDEVGDPK
jgi:hypothetical protein